ncbi:hypothetical protein JA13_299 [Dickeya phage vB_DsoM_JA13]|uniref:Uncharacterized protein n=1 Tax=Dickeya phage vB_DsoM_JA13 TaxID=2283030 RepID=A0A384ZWT2_9CAUD|nr:hypothetical protein JA13_299 [Dickeya phage vB_DsoM_JA13]
MSAVTSQNDFDAVRTALESILKANEDARRGLYEKGELFNDNFLKFSVSDLHKSLQNTPRRKLPQIVEKVLGDFNFRAIHGDWALVKHDAPDFTLIELPHSATNVVGVTFSKDSYKGKLVELGDTDFAEPVVKEKVKPPAKQRTKKVIAKKEEVKSNSVVQEEVEPEHVENAPASVLEVKKRRAAVEKLSPEDRRQSSGTYQQLKFVLLSMTKETLDVLAETLNIGELEPTVRGAVEDILRFMDFESIRDAADNMGITLKARNNADAALLEFLIVQSK